MTEKKHSSKPWLYTTEIELRAEGSKKKKKILRNPTNVLQSGINTEVGTNVLRKIKQMLQGRSSYIAKTSREVGIDPRVNLPVYFADVEN